MITHIKLLVILLLNPSPIICYNTVLEVKMPSVSPKKGEYLCTSEPIDLDKIYALNFEAIVQNKSIVNHILVYGCEEPRKKEYYWECAKTKPCAQQKELLLYVWDQNDSSFKLPKNVGFQLGTSNKIQYLVLQVHYTGFVSDGTNDESSVLVSVTSKPQKFLAGSFVFSPCDSNIPLNLKGHMENVDIECAYHGDPIIAFAYSGYNFKRGSTSAYRFRDNHRFLIGELDVPQSQAFTIIPKGKRVLVHESDILTARCTFIAQNTTDFLKPGELCNNQICSFYFMYYKVNTPRSLVIDQCHSIKWDQFSKDKNALENSEKRLLKSHYNPTGVTRSMQSTLLPSTFSSSLFKIITNGRKMNSSGIDEKFSIPKKENASLSSVTMLKLDGLSIKIQSFPFPIFVNSWKLQDNVLKLIGNVTSVDVNKNGSVFILNSADRSMDIDSFDEENFYAQSYETIKENTILFLNPDGSLKTAFGKNLFILPVRLRVDHQDDIWVIDIALHQILKFSLSNLLKPSLVLGERLTPGYDQMHFCQPADLVVMLSGFFFVADGYCNNRIIKFDADGKFMKEFRNSQSAETYPLALALDSNDKYLYVGYRYSILVFKTDGSFLNALIKEAPHLELRSMAYSHLQGGVLFVISGQYGEPIQGLTINTKSGEVLNIWLEDQKNFFGPTHICTSYNQSKLYLSNIGGRKISQYYIQSFSEEVPFVNNSTLESLEDDSKSEFSDSDGITLMPVIVIVSILATPIVLVAVLSFIQCVRLRRKRYFALRERAASKMRRYETTFFDCCATPTYHYSADRVFDKFLNDHSDDDEDENLFTRKA